MAGVEFPGLGGPGSEGNEGMNPGIPLKETTSWMVYKL